MSTLQTPSARDTPRPPSTGLPTGPTRGELYGILAGVMLVLFLANLSQGVVVTALPLIGQELGDKVLLPWVMTGYLLASTVMIPIFGKLSDILGRRLVVLGALVLFTLGSVACALAPSMLWLVLARILQGLGGAGLTSMAFPIIADVIAPRDRPKFQPFLIIFYMAGSLGGPVLGGFIAEHFGWTYLFWMNLPLGLIGLVIAWVTLRKLPHNHRPARLDVEGALILTGATIALLLAISGQIRDGVIIGALVVASAALWTGFGFWLSRSPNPLIPLHVMANRVLCAGTISAMLGTAAFIALTTYTPFYFEYALGLTPSQSGMALLIPLIAFAAGNVAGGQLMVRVRRYRWIGELGLVVGAAGFIGLCFAAWLRADLVVIETLMVLVGVGAGILITITSMAIQNAVPMSDLGAALGFNSFVRQLGAAALIAIFGAILAQGGMAATSHAEALDPRIIRAFIWLCGISAAATVGALAALMLMDEQPLRGGPEGPS